MATHAFQVWVSTASIKIPLMKKSVFISIGLCLALVIAIGSCRKPAKDNATTPAPATTGTNTTTTTYNPPTYYYADKSKLNALFAAFRSTPQQFTVRAGSRRVVYGSRGTRLTFYPNSFADAAGNIIKDVDIKILLTEMYKPGDMIANRATTVSGGTLLQSGGQVRITATRGSEQVYATKYGIGFPQPAPSTQSMALFYGNTANADSVTSWGSASTTAGTTASGTTTSADTSMPGKAGDYYYFDSCTEFNWVNCDYFYGYTSPLTNVNIVTPDTSFNASNTQAYLVFPSINSVTNTSSYSAATHTFSLYQPSYLVPIGMEMHLVVMSNKSGKYYYYQKKGIFISANMTENVVMTEKPLAEIKSLLSAL